MDGQVKPLFSVIIPGYNASKYISECIYSVLNQTIQDCEIILIDDGSTDGSGMICDDFSKKHPGKILVTHQSNKGEVLARRKGIEQARGDIFLFLDADDKFHESALEKIKNAFDEYECHIVMFTAVFFNSSGEDRKVRFPFSDGQVFESDSKKVLYRHIASGSLLNNLAYKAVKREVIDFDIDYSSFVPVTRAGDLFQVIPLITNAQRIVYIDSPLYCYRRGHVSVSSHYNISYYEALKLVNKRIEEYVTKWGMKDELTNVIKARRLRTITYAICGYYKIHPKYSERKIVIEFFKTVSNDDYFLHAYSKSAVSNMLIIDKILILALK